MGTSLFVAVVISFTAFAQQGPTLVNTAYPSPSALAIAPGQIVRIQVSGLKTVLPPGSRFQRAAAIPLPTTLAGLSVTIRQSLQQSIMGPVATVSYAAPMVSVDQVPLCSNGTTPDCFTTFLTIQVPFEIQVALTAPPIVSTELSVTENGAESQSFTVAAAEDQIHVVTTYEGRTGVPCQSIVTHADGALITASSPARPGETVVIYGWGFGVTSPRVQTGQATPEPAPASPFPDTKRCSRDWISVRTRHRRTMWRLRPEYLPI